MRRKAKRPPTVPHPEQQNDEQDTIQLPPSIDSFLKAAKQEGDAIRVILYRRVKEKTGRPKRCFLEEYENEAPTLKDIALEHGGGEYELQAFTEAQEGEKPDYFKSIQFNIDERYSDLKASKTAAPAHQIPQYDPAQQFQQSMGMITTLVQAIAPLFQQQQAAAAAANPAQLFSSMAELSNNMIATNFKNQMENQKIIMETLREATPAAMAGDEPEDKSFERIMQALEMFIPMFLKAPAPMQKTLVKTAQAQPDVKAIIASKVRKAALKKKLIEKLGTEQAEKVFQIFDNGNGKGTQKQKEELKAAAAATA